MSKIDLSKIKDVEMCGIYLDDAPDFVDAYIGAGTIDGRDLTEEELEEINNNSDYVYQQVMKFLY